MKKYKGLKVLPIDPIGKEELIKAQDLMCTTADIDECGSIECEDCLYEKDNISVFTKWLKKKAG